MAPLRTFLRRHAAFAALILAAALLVRIAVPGGFMPQFAGNTIAVTICSSGGAHTAIEIPVEKKVSAGPTCAFADLSVPGLAAADPILLALALAFVMALWLAAPPSLRLPSAGHLRPPLRGPPSHR